MKGIRLERVENKEKRRSEGERERELQGIEEKRKTRKGIDERRR